MWNQVRAAGRLDAPDARQALEALCRVYWQPIYAFLRRCGHKRENAQDLTQGFFAYLLEQRLLQKANPDRGRFRSFLLGSLKCFVSNQQAKEQALKRGGGICLISIDPVTADGIEPATNLSPDRLFDRKWSLVVIGEAMKRLAAEYRRGGMAEQFTVLQPYLTGDADGHLSDLAVRLGKSDGAMRILVFRLRNRFRRLIRAVIADTVSDLDQVESELRHLEEALRDG
jgi:RNA polymerase sigma-70 factor (ECF subfamily)